MDNIEERIESHLAEISKIIRQCERDISTTDKKLITATLRQCNKTLKTLLRTTMDVNTPPLIPGGKDDIIFALKRPPQLL